MPPITTRVHTLFLTVGPTQCGKTTFCKETLIPALAEQCQRNDYRCNVQYLSSDDTRRELLGGRCSDPYSTQFQECSGIAFDLLMKRIEQACSFPVSAEFVIVDSTALREDFRDSVLEIAKKYHYTVDVILFKYKSQDEYFAGAVNKKLVAKHVARMSKEVYPKISLTRYARVHTIRAKGLKDHSITVEDWAEYARCILPTDHHYFVIGDVHECVDELRALIAQCGFEEVGGVITPTNKSGANAKVVLVGDVLDKGHKTKETLDFLARNITSGVVVIVEGNHERFLYRAITEPSTTSTMDPAFVAQYFTALKVLQSNEELRNQFLEIHQHMVPFAWHFGVAKPSFIVTHAPCESKFLGKVSESAKRAQRRFDYRRDEPIEPQVSEIFPLLNSCAPVHIFGHVALNRHTFYRNRLFLDSGCVHGNKLTAFSPTHDFAKTVSFLGKQPKAEEALPLFAPADETGSAGKYDISYLSFEEKRRLKSILKRQVNYISGTVCPADKDVTNNVLESFAKGIEHFKTSGVKILSIQPKYMGSRCNLYLHKDAPELCSAVSRNGFKVNCDITEVIKVQMQRLRPFMEVHNIRMLILDGELMPWRALGKGLVEQHFNVLAEGLGAELDELAKSGFEEQFSALKEHHRLSAFEAKAGRLGKAKLMEEFKTGGLYQTYSAMKDIPATAHVPLAEHVERFQVFKRQLAIHGADTPVEYKPFAILKAVMEDGAERFPEDFGLGNVKQFELLSTEVQCVVDLDNEESIQNAFAFWGRLNESKVLEGIVMKPDSMRGLRGVAPFLKVRNADYLALVYGYDYLMPCKYGSLLANKGIKRKLQASLKEYYIGLNMLRTPHDSISESNTEYSQLVASFLFEEKNHMRIDPRL